MVELSYPSPPGAGRKRNTRTRPAWEAELRLAALLIPFGVLVLPIAVYVVGQQVFGEYASEDGWWGLLNTVWGDLLTGSPAAWLLVLSPYVVIQLVRLGAALWRHARA